MSRVSGLWEKPISGRGWLWIILGIFGGLLLCGLALAGLGTRQALRQSASSSTEKTPQLATPVDAKPVQRSIIILEPAASSTADSSSGILPPVSTDELTLTPKKKSNRRRVRGKKKKGGFDSPLGENEGEAENDEDEDKGEGSSSPPSSVLRRGEKPLPELPRELSSTDILDQEDKERLVISDVVIGA